MIGEDVGFGHDEEDMVKAWEATRTSKKERKCHEHRFHKEKGKSSGRGDKEHFGKIMKSHAPEQQTRLLVHDSDEATSSSVQKRIIFLKDSSSSETSLDI